MPTDPLPDTGKMDATIWSGAYAVHRQYGDKSLGIARMRVAALLAEGDRAGHDIWYEIYRTLTILAPRKKSGTTLH
ncbi:hypothetical protein GCM10011529_27350 [Polymorphobacter glacialis]|uniref:Uncharacterized protein n=2 Tax=Sandarakinorhabdus glacialis TaxID=1614636 RepID=A0A917EBS3_9SPHN|nr:hypothetical protein GCM10011529_27350 [Polymorphobacter glacialis]